VREVSGADDRSFEHRIGERRAGQTPRPTADRFIRDVHAQFSRQAPDVAIARREPRCRAGQIAPACSLKSPVSRSLEIGSVRLGLTTPEHPPAPSDFVPAATYLLPRNFLALFAGLAEQKIIRVPGEVLFALGSTMSALLTFLYLIDFI